ncbi:SH3 domain-binding protein 2 isoform X2 [Narcine bancroftii]|uniref:SH3 domain-binding protein 2 isoform X2 n=1 Tax=Narcine bancroftii TaxID=1343680 RepID=UPI003831080D
MSQQSGIMRSTEETTSSNVFPFKIIHVNKKYRTWFFSASCEEERKKWMMCLRREINCYHEKVDSPGNLSDTSDMENFYGSVECPVEIKYPLRESEAGDYAEDDEDEEGDYLKPDGLPGTPGSEVQPESISLKSPPPLPPPSQRRPSPRLISGMEENDTPSKLAFPSVPAALTTPVHLRPTFCEMKQCEKPIEPPNAGGKRSNFTQDLNKQLQQMIGNKELFNVLTPQSPPHKGPPPAPPSKGSTGGPPPIPSSKGSRLPISSVKKSGPPVLSHKDSGPPTPSNKESGPPLPSHKGSGPSISSNKGTLVPYHEGSGPPIPSNKGSGPFPVPSHKGSRPPPIPSHKGCGPPPVPSYKGSGPPIPSNKGCGPPPVPSHKGLVPRPPLASHKGSPPLVPSNKPILSEVPPRTQEVKPKLHKPELLLKSESGVRKPPPPVWAKGEKHNTLPLCRASPDGQSFRSPAAEKPFSRLRSQSQPVQMIHQSDEEDEDYENVQLPASLFLNTTESNDVERLFMSSSPDNNPENGLFCIRNSSKSGKVLVVWDSSENKVRNYRIFEKESKFYLESEIKFMNLTSMVEFYYNHTLPIHENLYLKVPYDSRTHL